MVDAYVSVVTYATDAVIRYLLQCIYTLAHWPVRQILKHVSSLQFSHVALNAPLQYSLTMVSISRQRLAATCAKNEMLQALGKIDK